MDQKTSILLTSLLIGSAFVSSVVHAGENPTRRGMTKTDQRPRKAIVATTIFGPHGAYPGLKERIQELSSLVDRMAAEAARKYPGSKLDLAILPESAVTSTAGPARERAVPLKGLVRDSFSSLARKHQTYLVVPLDLAEGGPGAPRYSNAAVLFDRRGGVVGVYRKAHPVAYVGSEKLEAGITPGSEFPVFDCDFGKLGMQICWDIQFADGWEALARGGAEVVAWTTASPATVLPAARAQDHRYYIVSSTWRDNATIFEPTGMVAAQAGERDRVLVQEIDLSYAILGWSGFLKEGQALREKYGANVGFHYSNREDMGLFWSNDPATSIASMIRSIGGEPLDDQVERNRRLQDAAKSDANPPAITVTVRKPDDRATVAGDARQRVVSIHSASGIGGASLRRTSTSWPDQVLIRLHLCGLESLKVVCGDRSLSGSASSNGAPPELVLKPEGNHEVAVHRGDPLWMEIRAIDASGKSQGTTPLTNGYFEFALPKALFEQGAETIGIEWIDFYR